MSEEHTMNWTCEQIEARLGDYVDGLLQPAERAAFEAHAAQHCERCAPLISSVTQLVSDLHGMELLEPPPRLVYAILDKTLGPRDTVVAAPGFFGWLRGIGMPRFAYGALSLSATFLDDRQRFGIFLAASEAGGSTAGDDRAQRGPPGASGFCARLEIRERPAGGIRNSNAFAAGQ